MVGAIGAGLAMKLIVSFETQTLEECEDVMKVVSEENFS